MFKATFHLSVWCVQDDRFLSSSLSSLPLVVVVSSYNDVSSPADFHFNRNHSSTLSVREGHCVIRVTVI